MKKKYFAAALLPLLLLLTAGGWVPKSDPSLVKPNILKPTISPVAPSETKIKPVERAPVEPSRAEGEVPPFGIKQFSADDAGYGAKGIVYSKELNQLFIGGLKGYTVFLLGISPLGGEFDSAEFPVTADNNMVPLSVSVDKFGFVTLVGYSGQDLSVPGEGIRSVGTGDGEPVRAPGVRTSNNDIFVIRYNPVLKKINWIKQWGSPADWSGRNVRSLLPEASSCSFKSDNALAAASDVEGFTYIVGTTTCLDARGNGVDVNNFLIQVSPFMLFHWVREFGSENQDSADAVATDAEGNIYVGGATDISSFWNQKATVFKFNMRGEKLWDANFGGGTTGDTRGPTRVTGIVVDNANHVLYVTGNTSADLDASGSATGNNNGDIFLAKYDLNGNPLWTAPKQFGTLTYAPSVAGEDTSTGIALDTASDSRGIIYVSGYTNGFFPGRTLPKGETDAVLLKLDSDGNLLTVQWPKQIGSDKRDDGAGVVTDGIGNVFVAGTTYGSVGEVENPRLSDIFVIEYGPDGAMK